MRIGTKIQSTVLMLDSFFESSAPFDIIMAKFFRTNKWIGSHERREIAEFSYSIFRKYEAVKSLTQKITTNFGRFAVLAYLKYFEKFSDEKLEEIFSGEKFCPGKLTDFERKFLASCNDSIKPYEEMPQNVRLNYPAWMESHLIRAFWKNHLSDEMSALNQKALVDIRVNTLKSTKTEVKKQLSDSGFSFEDCKLSKNGLRISNGRISRNHPVIAKGLAEIQDEGSQLIAEICKASPKDTVVDFCAGAGGKTLAIAASMNNKGRIFALDKYFERLENAKLRFRRANVNNVTCLEISSKWLKRHKESANIVLVDAPCSGTGTWRRNPDMRAKFQQKDLDELIAVQKQILENAAPLVKKGGKLIYSTCSILLEENDDQIKHFLEKFPEFRLAKTMLSFDAKNNDNSNENNYFLRLSPFRNGTDGFFAACMEKIE